MNLEPCVNLSFDGSCEEAFDFYARSLGGKVAFKLTWGDSPMAKDAPPEWSGKLCHATLILGDTTLLGSDAAPGKYVAPRGFSITLGLDDREYAERLFGMFAEKGTVIMPLQETFWAERFGVVQDQFGIQWDFNCEKAV
jgi:PhnB protein